MNTQELLARIPLFQKLTPEQLDKVIGITQTLSVGANTDVIRQGQEGEAFYAIVSGQVDVISPTPKNPNEVIAVLGPGEYFGEMSFLTGRQCSATVRTSEPCQFISIPRGPFNELLMENFELYRYFTQVLCVRLENMTHKLEDLVEQRTRELAETNKALNEIMESINESILTISQDGVVNPEFSRRSVEIYGPRLAPGVNFVDFLADAEDKKDYWKKWIRLAFTNRFLDWSALGKLMPCKKLVYRAAPDEPPKQVCLNILPIDVEDKGRVTRQKLMVISTDVTREEDLERKISEDNRRNKMTLTLLQSRDLFEDFCAETGQRFRIVARLFRKPRLNRKDVREVFRLIHTVKGSAASLNMYPVAELCHQLETDLAKSAETDQTVSPPPFRAGLARLEAAVATVRRDFERIAGRSDPNCHAIEEWEIQTIRKHIRRGRFQDASRSLDDITKPSLYAYLFPKAHAVFQQACSHTGKKAQLLLRIQRARVPRQLLRVLEVAVVHLLRNAVDHGLEPAQKRRRRGKPAEGRIRLRAQIQQHRFTLEVADDGGGIDTRKLVRTAVQNGILTAAAARALKKAQKLDLIFSPSFSTKKTADELSGRGVGLDAVKRAIERAGGTIRVRSRLNRGTTFIVTLDL